MLWVLGSFLLFHPIYWPFKDNFGSAFFKRLKINVYLLNCNQSLQVDSIRWVYLSHNIERWEPGNVDFQSAAIANHSWPVLKRISICQSPINHMLANKKVSHIPATVSKLLSEGYMWKIQELSWSLKVELGTTELRAALHIDQEPWPWKPKGPWKSSKCHTMGNINPILQLEGPWWAWFEVL